MSRERDFSDEFLNAFVDDQLGADEQGRVYAQLNQDENTKRQVCELRTTRELVQFAYKDLPVSMDESAGGTRQNRVGMGIAASITLALGLVMGWTLHQPTNKADLARDAESATSDKINVSAVPATNVIKPTKRSMQAKTLVATASGPQTAAVDNAITKILVHFNSGHSSDAGQILDDLEGMLKLYSESGQIARIELVVNSEGLNLLRIDTSRYAKRILRMQEQYDNLTFVACQNTIDRLKREQGIVARLLPGVVVIDSGVAQLMRRQHQGWAYIQA